MKISEKNGTKFPAKLTQPSMCDKRHTTQNLVASQYVFVCVCVKRTPSNEVVKY